MAGDAAAELVDVEPIEPIEPVDRLERERRLAACEGKSSFQSWGHAKRRARLMSRREHERGNRVHFSPYRCRHCSQIHIGSHDRITNRNPRTRRGRPRRDEE